jgi:hypothetical protein
MADIVTAASRMAEQLRQFMGSRRFQLINKTVA